MMNILKVFIAVTFFSQIAFAIAPPIGVVCDRPGDCIDDLNDISVQCINTNNLNSRRICVGDDVLDLGFINTSSKWEAGVKIGQVHLIKKSDTNEALVNINTTLYVVKNGIEVELTPFNSLVKKYSPYDKSYSRELISSKIEERLFKIVEEFKGLHSGKLIKLNDKVYRVVLVAQGAALLESAKGKAKDAELSSDKYEIYLEGAKKSDGTNLIAIKLK